MQLRKQNWEKKEETLAAKKKQRSPGERHT